MSLEEICALPVGRVCHDRCDALLWSPTPMLEQALSVIRAWGFEYRNRVRLGQAADAEQGNICGSVTSTCSLLVVAICQHPRQPTVPTRSSRLRAESTAASRTMLYALIERMYPDLPRIELFARREREGWDRWGKEAPPEQDAAE